jgi:hypothetical protein
MERVVVPVAVNILFAVIAFMGLFSAYAFANALREWLRRQQSFDPFLVELGITVLGSVGTVFFLTWLIGNRFALLLPGLACGGLALVLLFRGSEGLQAAALDLSFSLGAVAAFWAFVRGLTDAKDECGRLLGSIGFQYESWARGAFTILLIGIALLTIRKYDQQRKREVLKHYELMRDQTYRELQDEKLHLGRQLRDVVDRQLHIETKHATTFYVKAR